MGIARGAPAPAKKKRRKPASERKGTQIAFRLSEEEAALVKTEAERAGMRLSTFVRSLLDKHMAGISPNNREDIEDESGTGPNQAETQP